MTRFKGMAAAWLLAGAAAGAADSAPFTIAWPVTNAVDAGQAIVAAASAHLASNLLAALAEGGVSNALPYCSDHAIDITEQVARQYDIALKRISHRPRNSDSRVELYEQGLVGHCTNTLAEGNTPGPMTLSAGDRVTYYQPIILNLPLCLQCHGEPGQDIATNDLKLIRELYPNDEATGFKLGEFRGLWKIVFPVGAVMASPPPPPVGKTPSAPAAAEKDAKAPTAVAPPPADAKPNR
jgi:hypothetical protein